MPSLCFTPLLTFAALVIDVSRTTRYFRHLGLTYFLSLSHLSASLSLRYFSRVILSKVPPYCKKDCIDIYVYLMKILSNKNATFQDYQPSVPTALHHIDLAGEETV